MGSTDGHYSKRYLVVSETEPVDPADGLLWFDPTPCPPTTTTTEEPVTTTTTTAEPFFMMKFDDLDNASLMIGGDASDVADWNTFFDLPTNGTPFDNIALDGVLQTVTLYGGGNMTLSAYLFGDNEPTGTSLLEVEDNGVTIACEDGVFSDYGIIAMGCYGLTKVYLIECLTFNDFVFADCEELIDVSFPKLENGGDSVFDNVNNITNISLPSMNIATNMFVTLNLSLEIINIPSLLVIGNFFFNGCSIITNLDISSCTNLGSTTGNNGVFDNIVGMNITITIPHALEADGDIVWLKANNFVTVLYSD